LPMEDGALAQGVPNPLASDLVDLVPDMICVCEGTRITFVNRAGAAMLGAGDPAQVLGEPFDRFIHPDFAVLMDLGLTALAQEPGVVPLILRGLDGSLHNVHMRVREAVGEPGRLMLHARDVTDRCRSVSDLLDSEHRFRRLVEHSFSLIFVVRGALITFANPEGLRLLEAEQESQVLGRPITDFLHPDYRPIGELGLPDLIEDRGPLYLKVVTLSGRVLDVESRLSPFGIESSGAYMVEARDISARRRAAESLRDREQRLKGILDSVAEAIITTDDQGIILSFNQSAQAMFGFLAAEAIGQNIAILMPPEFARVHDHQYRRLRRDMGSRVLGLVRTVEGLRKDGSRFPAEICLNRLFLAGGAVIIGVIRDVTERVLREEAEARYKEDLEHQVQERTREVRRLAHQTELILRSADDGILGLDVGGRVTFANAVAERLLDVAAGGLVGRRVGDVIRTSDRSGPPADLLNMIEGHADQAGGESPLMAVSGTLFTTEYAAAPIYDEGHRLGAVVVFRDITARKRAEAQMRLAYTVFDTAAAGIVVCDVDRNVEMVNPAFTAITGYTEADVRGRPMADLLFGASVPFSEVAEAMEGGGSWEGEYWHNRKDGQEMALRVVASLISPGPGVPATWAMVINDITQRKRNEEHIHFQANHDSLTRLPNRALFMDLLADAVADAASDGAGLAVMFVDLDGFKAINDTLGHDAGDLLLKGVAQRIRGCARQQDTVARLGGDEFTVILPGAGRGHTAARVARRILDVLSAPFSLKGALGHVSASIGIAILPDSGNDAETLLRHADEAMYEAKARGKATFAFHRMPEAGEVPDGGGRLAGAERRA